MEVREAIYRRRSCRAFTPAPVAKKTLLQLVDAAIQAPSARNMQPWHFIVVTGQARQRLVDRLAQRYAEEQAQGIEPPALDLARPFAQRVEEFLAGLTQAAQQAPGFDLMTGSLAFYGAPALILVALDASLPPDRLFDLGAAVENLLLLAHSQGLGTCVIGIALRYKDTIRQVLQLPERFNLVMTVAVGVPDRTHPLAAFTAGRQDVAEFLTWID